MNHSNYRRVAIYTLFLLLSPPVMAKSKPEIRGSVLVKEKGKVSVPSLAKISLQEAVEIAERSTEGKASEVSLELKSEYLVYEIDVVIPKVGRKELIIDAGDGKILNTRAVAGKGATLAGEDDDEK